MDPGNITEQKLWVGSKGVGGIAWDDHEEYVAYVSQYGGKLPVRTGHPVIYTRGPMQESLHQMNVRATRYIFPGGLNYSKWGFTGDMKSSGDGPMQGYIAGNSTSTSTDIWHAI